jgi:hypothetical protein
MFLQTQMVAGRVYRGLHKKGTIFALLKSKAYRESPTISPWPFSLSPFVSKLRLTASNF